MFGENSGTGTGFSPCQDHFTGATYSFCLSRTLIIAGDSAVKQRSVYVVILVASVKCCMPESRQTICCAKVG
jgi:hypothetical protein